MENLSVIIPVYNAEKNLMALYEQLLPALEALTDCFEVILVEDCGEDRSWEVIQQIVAKDSRVNGIKLRRNFGQHNALLCGIRAARYEVIVTMDDDLQHPPTEISKLLDKLSEGYDVVYGTPQKEQHGLLRDLASRMTKLTLQGAMGAKTASSVSAFRVFRASLRDGFSDYRSPYVSIDVLLTWATGRFSAIPVRHESRMHGNSNYTLGKLVTHAFNMMTGFSTLPLKMASYIGFIFTLFGFMLLVWVLLNYFLFDVAVEGFTFIASVVVIFSGAQLFALGIFGEYLARIYVRSMGRPTYLMAVNLRSEEARAATRTTAVKGQENTL